MISSPIVQVCCDMQFDDPIDRAKQERRKQLPCQKSVRRWRGVAVTISRSGTYGNTSRRSYRFYRELEPDNLGISTTSKAEPLTRRNSSCRTGIRSSGAQLIAHSIPLSATS